jgi:hypothetical protein
MILYLFITGTVLWAFFMVLILKPKKMNIENSGGESGKKWIKDLIPCKAP